MAELQEFLDAQDTVYVTVIAELKAGRKSSHWIWYIFPQLKQLGRSHMAQHFGLADADEAASYLAHPILGKRLEEVAALLLATGDDPVRVLGDVDALKVRSSMTLFATVAKDTLIFQAVLDQMYDGIGCTITTEFINESAP